MVDFKINTEKQYKTITKYLNEDVREIFASFGGFLAGGAITSLFTKRPVNDWDIFFPSVELADSAYKMLRKNNTWKHAFTSASALSFEMTDVGLKQIKEGINQFDAYGVTVINDGRKVQIVTGFCGSIKEVFSQFDFHCCMGAFDFKTNEFTFNENFFTDNITKTLRYNFEGNSNPINTFFRIDKYKKLGYDMPVNEVLKFILGIKTMKLNTVGEFKKMFDAFRPTMIRKELMEHVYHDKLKNFKFNNDKDVVTARYNEIMNSPIDIPGIAGILDDLEVLSEKVIEEEPDKIPVELPAPTVKKSIVEVDDDFTNPFAPMITKKISYATPVNAFEDDDLE